MTIEKAPWALDGPRLSSQLARRAEYAATSGESGVVLSGDLKVSALDTPGPGLKIAPGVGLLLNGYQSRPNEMYVTSNPDLHYIPESQMPPASSSARSFMVAVVVGDPSFSQVGHPFMSSSDPAPGQEATYEYVRIMLIQCAAGATSLGGTYPKLELARVDIPANTTTITNAMITNLSKLARPRQTQQLLVGTPWNDSALEYIPTGSTYQPWSLKYLPKVQVPAWANRCIIMATVAGVAVDNTTVNISGGIRVRLGGVNAALAAFDYQPRVGTDRMRDNLVAAGEFDVSSLKGRLQQIVLEAFQSTPTSPTYAQRLRLRSASQLIYDVRFFEE